MTEVETVATQIAWEPQVGQTGTPPLADTSPLGSFGAEFRELARQRRFVRSSAPGVAADPVTPDLAVTAPHPSAPEPARHVAPAVAAVPVTAPNSPSTDDAFSAAFAASLPTRHSSRISDDASAMLAELARMSDRLVATREELATTRARAEYAEARVVDADARLMAARVLVQDAQNATRQSAERAAWLEGRCETLQDALDLAVNASFVSRWKWRRQLRAQSSARY
ncbi:MAG: hypothetical protein JWN41_1155 [Thermoleophilia bacterium]|nr:hypothetical protein [Thermoleophilia bacterium]